VSQSADPQHPQQRLRAEFEQSTFLRWAATGASASGDAGSAVYGTIVAASVLLGARGGPLSIALSMLAAGIVFWLAHAHVDLLRAFIRDSTHITPRRVVEALTREWPIIQATFLPAVPLVLAALNLIAVDTGRWLGVLICLVGLVAWGIVVSRGARLSRRSSLLVIGINLALGLLIVALKVIIH
jgi:amino acid transporter